MRIGENGGADAQRIARLALLVLAGYGDAIDSFADVVPGNVPFLSLALIFGTMAWLAGRRPNGGKASQ